MTDSTLAFSCTVFKGDTVILYPLGIRVNPAVTSVKSTEELPTRYSLHQNYPNPFNPTTTISYQLPMQNHVTLKVFDMLGREVATLVNGVEEPGYKSINFNANRLSSGMYFYRLQAGNYIETKKLVLLK